MKSKQKPKPLHHAFKRLHDLGREVVAQVDKRLMDGETPNSVASWLQGDLQVLLDIKMPSLKKNLERYRATDLKDRVVQGIIEKAAGTTVASLQRRLIAMEAMEELAWIQKHRMEVMVARESETTLKSGILLVQASDAIKLYKDTITELGRLQLETGVMIRAPRRLTGQVMDPATGDVKQFSWTDEQEALHRQLENIDFSTLDVVDIEDAPDVRPA